MKWGWDAHKNGLFRGQGGMRGGGMNQDSIVKIYLIVDSGATLLQSVLMSK